MMKNGVSHVQIHVFMDMKDKSFFMPKTVTVYRYIEEKTKGYVAEDPVRDK